MLRWALAFLIISIVAGVFGFGGISEVSGDIAKVIFFVFISLFVLALVGGLMLGKKLLS